MAESSADEMDEQLYSRQLYVLGRDAMRRLAAADVLVSGLTGLGVEVAKNLALAGVRSLTLHDRDACRLSDLGSQFFLSEEDVGKNRAEASAPRLAQLNSHVSVRCAEGPVTAELVRRYRVLVLAGRPLREQLRVAQLARAAGAALVVADCRGLFGQLFCDFGDRFTVSDCDGEEPASSLVASITRAKEGVVTCLADTHHGLQDGDFVTFSEVRGMEELNSCEPLKIRYINPYTFGIGDTSQYSEYTSGGVVKQVKVPKTMCFKPLAEAMRAPEFLQTDFGKEDRPMKLHLAFVAFHKYVEQCGEPPKAWNENDADSFIEIVNTAQSDLDLQCDSDREFYSVFSKICSGSVQPLIAAIGGIAAQEALKACSGKFTPLYQWLYLDALECLPKNIDRVGIHGRCPIDCRYDGQITIFGHSVQIRLGSFKCFVVGAGAVGCEVLKNLAMMGVGTFEKGRIDVTDMDHIEVSNLNRQFLFRPQDIMRPKSQTAAKAIKIMNPYVNMGVYELQVGSDTEEVFDDEFFSDTDAVIAALDSVTARIYLDQRCVFYQKPMLEAGTLGTKGHTQVVIPFLTESYSSSQDPPEKTIPMCTLKNFPYAIEHTLIWARDAFEGLFSQEPEQAARYLTESDFVQSIKTMTGFQPVEVLKSVKKVLLDEYPNTFEDCVAWARRLWQELFNNQIRQLLHIFPPNQTTSDGEPFWTGAKRCPTPLEFSAGDPLHLNFILAAANLKAEVHGIKQNRDLEAITNIVKGVEIPEFQPKNDIKIPINEIQGDIQDNISGEDDIKNIINDLPPKSKFQQVVITPLKFEKDDDTNLHIDFIVAASNLRAANYKIAAADRQKSKLIAGKITPAIATTTSVVAGLLCLELYKIVQEFAEIDYYKNSFINLALPFFTLSEPVAAPTKELAGTEWTLWDRFDIYGEITLEALISHFKETYNLDVTMLSYGVSTVYSFFMDKTKCQERLGRPLSEVVKEVSKKDLDSKKRSLVLQLCCSDELGNDVDVPYIRYLLPGDKIPVQKSEMPPTVQQLPCNQCLK
ncbi:ubiquitin-like modifier-activating enzyme 1 [Schistocerca gregaria]|uniref:ubiquitin-like modifier-activating enzyme 1 n=1 Tax=Schistocerca gregaria TaxID=7010 RepID=UPI00211DBE2E|nr:ubiquitin-like modifier-activating enzyme 1 [Schistocerca gregaria]